MSLTVRPAHDGDLDQIMAIDARVFNATLDDTSRARGRRALEAATILVLQDNDETVGVSANYRLSLTVPGGTAVPMAGVSWVGVLPTHHRRGGLTAMMAALLDDARQHEEPIAGLFASESVIYRRYGFGAASRTSFSRIDTRHAQFRLEHDDDGSIEFVSPERAVALLTPLHVELRSQINGMVSRPTALLESDYMPAPPLGPAENIVVHRAAEGTVDGVMRYSIKDNRAGPLWLPQSEVTVHELWATRPPAEIALWRHALEMDFTTSVSGHMRPLEEPICDLLADPRRWRIEIQDALHLRIIDADRLLGTRRYLRDGEVVLELVEPDGNRHRHRLIAAGEQVECRTTQHSADLTLDVASLSMLFLGDSPAERLNRAGLIEEHRAGSVARATAMFLWAPLPWAGAVF